MEILKLMNSNGQENNGTNQTHLIKKWIMICLLLMVLLISITELLLIIVKKIGDEDFQSIGTQFFDEKNTFKEKLM